MPTLNIPYSEISKKTNTVWSYYNDITIDNHNKNVNTVYFHIGRYGKVVASITFPTPVTQHYAFQCVQKYLSQPLTQDYYDQLYSIGDLFCGGLGWEEDCKHYKTRGDCLSDYRFLEGITVENGKMWICCGS